jgi:hypothetical protein
MRSPNIPPIPAEWKGRPIELVIPGLTRDPASFPHRVKKSWTPGLARGDDKETTPVPPLAHLAARRRPVKEHFRSGDNPDSLGP